MRVAATRKKEEEKTKVGKSSLAPKAIGKGVAKRKANGKDERPSKKASVTPGEKLPKKPSLPKHGAGKGLMTTPDLVTQDSECRLLTTRIMLSRYLCPLSKTKIQILVLVKQSVNWGIQASITSLG